MSVREKSAKGVSGGRVALYRKYRPSKLADIVSQPQVTEILSAAVESGQLSHAYLFTGQRGTGKTSTARILAHLINKTPYDIDDPNTDLDIIEIDAASRGSVDDARELRDKSAIAPVAAPYKIYIIDEVHMLSTPAFNALLKIIEEPPAHIVFILATTEVQKVPATILSRVQRFHFRPVLTAALAEHLRQIADQEKIKIDDEALNLIAERGQGSFRDSIGLLDQLSNSGVKITRAIVEEILGLAPETAITQIIDAVTAHDVTNIVATLNDLLKDGVAPSLIVDQLIGELIQLAPDKPKLYELIEQLLEVAKSHAPEIKLTAILCSAAAKNPSTLAATAAPPKATVTLAEVIEQNIAEEQSGLTSDLQPPTLPLACSETLSPEDFLPSESETSIPDVPDRFVFVEDGSAGAPVYDVSETDGSEGKVVSERAVNISIAEIANGPASLTSTDHPSQTSSSRSRLLLASPRRQPSGDLAPAQDLDEEFGRDDLTPPAEINWDNVLAEVGNLDEPAVLATLKFADHEYENGRLTLYFSKTFHRKKADTAKFSGVLNKAFQKLYDYDVEIRVAKTPVRENSDAARILDIMGGGEMVRHGQTE